MTSLSTYWDHYFVVGVEIALAAKVSYSSGNLKVFLGMATVVAVIPAE